MVQNFCVLTAKSILQEQEIKTFCGVSYVYRGRPLMHGHARTPRVSVSRSIFALIDDRDRAYFGRGGQEGDKIGFIDPITRAIFGRSYAAEPDVLIGQLREDEAIAEADTLLLTVPNQLGVAYNAHVLEAILTTVAPTLGGARLPLAMGSSARVRRSSSQELDLNR